MVARATSKRAKSAEAPAETVSGVIEIDANNLPQTVTGPCVFFFGGQQIVVGEGEQAYVTADDVQLQNRYDAVTFLDNAPPSHPRCCKYFAPSLSDERNGAEAPEGYAFNRLRRTLGCSNPDMNKQGITSCQFGENQFQCLVFEADTPQVLRHMVADNDDVQVQRRREGRGAPLYALVLNEEEVDVWTGTKAEQEAYNAFENRRVQAARAEIVPIPGPQKESFFQKILTKNV